MGTGGMKVIIIVSEALLESSGARPIDADLVAGRVGEIYSTREGDAR